MGEGEVVRRMDNMNKKLHYCVLGLGITGISCLEFLTNNQIEKITATDVKNNLGLPKLSEKYPTVNFLLGELKIPDDADILVLSPGINQFLPVIQNAVKRGAKLTNDINLFLEQINILKKNSPIKVVAITGTNGKTTVVNILANMAEQVGVKYALCGNVGDPVLNYLSNTDVLLYIIELSSFQLELVDQLYCDVACILNITPDHLDRYADFAAYCAAKLKIYKNAKNIVYYREDLNTYNNSFDNKSVISFGKSFTDSSKNFSIDADYKWLMHGQFKMIQIKELALTGEHNILNSLACLAIGDLLNFPKNDMYVSLKNFFGLEHRCQIVGTWNGISWVNDSKGTNVGATIAALNANLSCNENYNKKLIIILGGINKNADLSMLQPFVANNCKTAILIGACKEQLFDILHHSVNCHIAVDLQMAVSIAKQIAILGDTVLFSPACASFDMFENYKHRGEVFKQCVLELYND